MDFSPSSFERSSPFSLLEFGDLVSSALALDSDRFPEQYLSLTPALFSFRPSSPVKKSALGRAVASAASGSRPRQMFDKIRRHASALVLRSPPHHFSPTVSAATPSYNSSLSSASDSFSNDYESDFIPYIPVASQHERAFQYSSTHSTSTSTLPSQFSLSTQADHQIFSRRSIPPSPAFSIRSSSSSSTTDPHSPITPITPIFFSDAQSQIPNHPYARSADHWSVGEDETEVTGDDPFAKGNVQVVRTQGYHNTSGASSSAPRKRTVRIAPIKPPPSCPLPIPPPSQCDDACECEQDVEWTLYLGIPPTPPLSPSPPSRSDKRLKKEKPKPKPKPKSVTPKSDPDWTLSLPLSFPAKSLCPTSWSAPSSPTPDCSSSSSYHRGRRTASASPSPATSTPVTSTSALTGPRLSRSRSDVRKVKFIDPPTTASSSSSALAIARTRFQSLSQLLPPPSRQPFLVEINHKAQMERLAKACEELGREVQARKSGESRRHSGSESRKTSLGARNANRVETKEEKTAELNSDSDRESGIYYSARSSLST